MRSAVVAAIVGIAATALLAHDPVSTKVSWEGEIKRLVETRCVSCHSEGGRAPMPLTTYEEARPWARAIREEVLARRMPRWHVVRGYGDFRNDPSLSAFEITLFAAWADGGAPRLPPVKPGASPKPVTPPVVTPPTPRAVTSGDYRALEVPCTSRSLPNGRVVGLKPALAKGADLRIIFTSEDGSKVPLLWLRDFDPVFAETYWLRQPLTVTRTMRVEMRGHAPCTLTVLLATRTAR